MGSFIDTIQGNEKAYFYFSQRKKTTCLQKVEDSFLNFRFFSSFREMKSYFTFFENIFPFPKLSQNAC